MNKEQLNAIKERVAKATAGPWEYDNEERGIWNNGGFNYLGTVTLSHIDADFIANAREDVPALVAEVEYLREMLRDTRKIVRHKVSEVKTLQNACKKHKAKQAALEFQLKVSIQHAEELDAELEAEVAEVERLQELMKGNDGMSVKDIRYQFVDLHRHFLNVQTENKQLRGALEFYADETKYERVELCDGDKEIYIERDGGEIARQALGVT